MATHRQPFSLLLLLLACRAKSAESHGSLVVPRPRNAADRDVAPWNATNLPANYDGFVDQPFCPIRSEGGKGLTSLNGQAC